MVKAKQKEPKIRRKLVWSHEDSIKEEFWIPFFKWVIFHGLNNTNQFYILTFFLLPFFAAAFLKRSLSLLK